jgi:CHASE3 domain sensor protein
MNDILNGLINIKDAIANSVNTFNQKNIFVKAGGKLDVNIATKQGNILYPATYQNSPLEDFASNPTKLAEKNFSILNEGFIVDVSVKIQHYSFLAFALLLFYILIFLSGLYGYYHKIAYKIQIDEIKKKEELDHLHELEEIRLQEIDALSEERELLLSEFDQLKSAFKTEKSQAEKTEEDLFDEIETLENKLKEIDRLKEKIQNLEKSQNHITRQKDKTVGKLEKRFKALYKNIEISSRALASLPDMTEEMSLKAEEIIHQLNSDPSLVLVKRKVFSKKGKTTSFEVVFAYNGRLYFRKTNDNRVEILTIGSKNTQAKDLMYLDNI